MKNIILLFSIVMILCSSITAQNDSNLEPCGTVEELRRLQELYPDEYPSDNDFEHWMSSKTPEIYESMSNGSRDVVTIPVVVHVIHNGDALGENENIPDAQIYSQIKVLNDDFRRKEGTLGFNTHVDGADSEIEFCLASIDPDGNSTNGINRVNLGEVSYDMTTANAIMKPQTSWDPTKYYNIWVCNLASSGGGGGILLGYAQFPSNSGLAGMPTSGGAAETDGVVCRYLNFGSVQDNDGNFNISAGVYGRTLTHETGHWLGLRHIWGDGGCNVDDFCSDTPESDDRNFGCPNGHVSCGTIDMIQNYMDYTSDLCTNVYTNDQKARMLTVLTNSIRRAELLNSTVCTGIPLVNVGVSQIEVCPSQMIEFRDQSTANPTQWNWSFPGGIPISSTEENPTVYYPNPGTYDVSLMVTNSFGEGNQSFTNFITVNESTNDEIYTQDFENGSLSGWTPINENGGTAWNLKTLNGESKAGFFSLYINNYDENEYGARDGIVSPSINLYARSSANLEFDYSYRQAVQAETDSLIVAVSTDGGITFPHILFADAENGSYNVATEILFNGSFEPTIDNDWCGGSFGANCISLDLSAFVNESDIRIKFENYSKNGNNFHIDNIKIISDCMDASISPLADFSSQNLGCNSLSTSFTDESAGVPTSWSWSFPGGMPSSSSERNPEVIYNNPGVYEVTLVATNAQGSSTKTVTDYVVVSDQVPTASFDFITSWGTVVFDNQSEEGAEYYWDFGDGNVSTEANPTHTYSDIDQEYTVSLTVTNGCGSNGTSLSIQTTSIENPFGENTSFNIYPNPNNGQFTIEVKGKNNSTANISAYDILGRVVYESKDQLNTQSWTKDINLLNQSSGTYIIKIDIEGAITYKKIVMR